MNLDELQLAYVEEDDDNIRLQIERKFDTCLDEATEVDGRLRLAAGLQSIIGFGITSFATWLTDLGIL